MTMFARRHYEEIARVLGGTKMDWGTYDRLSAQLCRAFANDSPNFKEERFRKAADKVRETIR